MSNQLEQVHLDSNSTNASSAALARKRRREILNSQSKVVLNEVAEHPSKKALFPSPHFDLPTAVALSNNGLTNSYSVDVRLGQTSAVVKSELDPSAAQMIHKNGIEGPVSSGQTSFTDQISQDTTTSRPYTLPKTSAIVNKKQVRYDPEVPMTKEEAAAWRKEQRKVRNRESAAASRQKTRDRIEELEAEVESIKAKYASATARLAVFGVNVADEL
mmetsp:Transcript_63365/g.74174  ORF Transcript_63365/g.74174 Transcript_63365/m.74174 type:complete len:216 (-) Transcript_63365:1594-2241(-)|eukprot:CAMPEP_0171299360 /NCGR_PEP_ID=MMETSP0816-20121228/8170_1 /TAXON_ID=420281 /ORGANISM="Proboscia inermis, Strain CCAP1064/1" /LENGTH=215 /DNA_ID=CAMNT_0011775093 /DNA_START=28 /DNA_END=675 /DNA_ORIENTATION=-